LKIKIANYENIPVIIGTLVSNLKDQHPFESVKTAEQELAETIFTRAQKKYYLQDYHSADSLFRIAKDFDALRFRAPEKINSIIKELALKHKCGIVNMDSVFNAESADGIVGNNLLIDHLHPSLSGYFLMGRIYFEEMIRLGYLPKQNSEKFQDTEVDSLVISNFAYSRLDSVVSEIRLLGLLNGWPFLDKPDFTFLNDLDLRDRVDSIAFSIAVENKNWEIGHRQAAEWFLAIGRYSRFADEMKVLTSQYSFKLSYYDYVSAELINAKEYDLAYPFLLKRYKKSPNAFSSKWLGNINLSRKDVDSAIKYLKQSIKFDNTDAQTFFNLSGAYIQKEDIKTALEFLEKCIEINPEFPNARSLKGQLTKILKQ